MCTNVIGWMNCYLFRLMQAKISSFVASQIPCGNKQDNNNRARMSRGICGAESFWLSTLGEAHLLFFSITFHPCCMVCLHHICMIQTITSFHQPFFVEALYDYFILSTTTVPQRWNRNPKVTHPTTRFDFFTQKASINHHHDACRDYNHHVNFSERKGEQHSIDQMLLFPGECNEYDHLVFILFSLFFFNFLPLFLSNFFSFYVDACWAPFVVSTIAFLKTLQTWF